MKKLILQECKRVTMVFFPFLTASDFFDCRSAVALGRKMVIVVQEDDKKTTLAELRLFGHMVFLSLKRSLI